jgi:hypothetical protein
VLRQNWYRTTLRGQESVAPSSDTQRRRQSYGLEYEEGERLSMAPAHYFGEVTKHKKGHVPTPRELGLEWRPRLPR